MKTKKKLKICIKALKEMVEPKGAYDMDRLKHASNTIKAISELAIKTLREIEYQNEI